ncbi:unknown [Psittacid alphaherpesvirus 1]|uniref:Virion protein US10 homolog n=1 Tax=Psittacid herpesvirus 1 (isolate Amazon parrot/-/97-0001/1997) TaxID=670426 RepID=US10_PSHV1|nr:virion protein US10 [Psittacid alphaherpesvirus 1]Q6UDG2.1 RecName: Full=Virion protein US10 homolog [Psittacid herpesvirus 1 Amazon parrot/1997]AAQ73748.1 unknown [Psittacid alphaherpesvirus 1]
MRPLSRLHFPRGSLPLCPYSGSSAEAEAYQRLRGVRAASELWCELHDLAEHLLPIVSKRGRRPDDEAGRSLMLRNAADRLRASFVRAVELSKPSADAQDKGRSDGAGDKQKGGDAARDGGEMAGLSQLLFLPSPALHRPPIRVGPTEDCLNSDMTSSDAAVPHAYGSSSSSSDEAGVPGRRRSRRRRCVHAWRKENVEARARAQSNNLRAAVSAVLLDRWLPIGDARNTCTPPGELEERLLAAVLAAAHWCCLWHDSPCGAGSLYADIYAEDIFATGAPQR